jgi:hypothetical protein
MGSCTEIIVLTRIFQDEINSGYMDLTFSVIAEVRIALQRKVCSRKFRSIKIKNVDMRVWCSCSGEWRESKMSSTSG